MANIFKENKAVNEHPNRNNFDLSKKSNVSLKFGTLYPVYCQPVVPGDSFDINVAYNLKLMPVLFPVQTKMRAHMHFFYVRNKNLWSNWENWISNLPNATQDLTPHPYIVRPDSDFVSGSIHDFLGVPTSAVASSVDTLASYVPYSIGRPLYQSLFIGAEFSDLDLVKLSELDISSSPTELLETPYSFYQIQLFRLRNLPDPVFSDGSYTYTLHCDFENCGSGFLNVLSEASRINGFFIEGSASVGYDSEDVLDTNNSLDVHHVSGTKFSISFLSDHALNTEYLYFCFVFGLTSSNEYADEFNDRIGFLYSTPVNGFVDYKDLNIPLYSRELHINALPYRGYESIYWAYYNNNVVSPMTIDGNPQFNRYNTNLGDGADNTNYHLFQRNYELDFLTSALPSPQQGVAPLVGMTALGDVTIEDENGITTAHAEIDNDGTISKVVLTSPAASIDHARTAMNIAASGMSINDFRQTNALQRLLETNIRKGYRYLDFIAGHFGKEPEYRELDMPEFIGGFSRDVNVSTVVSSADTLGADSGKSLGSYGGFAQVVGGSQHSIRHYCDDYGFIIGIMSVVPTPCYSQLLPKHMIAPDNFLDYYFPEFSQSGLQPITYKEVAPIQSYLDSLSDPDKSLEDTFGYNRPNYDMVSAVDELHGEFRGSLRNYVINRIFDSRPELGRDFLQINPSEINDIFVNTNPDDDTIIGEIGFSVHAKRPVPRVVIPNLGR